MKEKFNGLGIMSLIPVGSAVTKTLRLGSNMIDVLMNFNKATLIKTGNISYSEETY
jgi:hypothetical protein